MVESIDIPQSAGSGAGEEGSEGWDLTRMGLLYFAPVLVAGLIAAFLLAFLECYTRHRRRRRAALLHRQCWRPGVDALKGEVREQLVVNGMFVGTAEYTEAIVLNGEWFQFGTPNERTCLCCGPKWANDLARRGLNWTELHAREPDVTRDRALGGAV